MNNLKLLCGAEDCKVLLLDQADAYFMYGDDTFNEDCVEKYGWLTAHYDKITCK